jgi:hypothetical protein
MDQHNELRSAPLGEDQTARMAGNAPAGGEKAGGNLELLIGLLLALWAAVLAACDLGGSNADNGTLLQANKAANAYAWYQSKSIKQSLAEGEAALLTTLSESGTMARCCCSSAWWWARCACCSASRCRSASSSGR